MDGEGEVEDLNGTMTELDELINSKMANLWNDPWKGGLILEDCWQQMIQYIDLSNFTVKVCCK